MQAKEKQKGKVEVGEFPLPPEVTVTVALKGGPDLAEASQAVVELKYKMYGT